MDGGEKLGVLPLFRAKDMTDPDLNPLSVMAYVSQYMWIPKRDPPSSRVEVRCDIENRRVNKPVSTAHHIFKLS